MASTTLIASNAAAANSSAFTILVNSYVRVFCTPALGPDEVIKLQCSYDGGTSWIDIIDPEHGGVVLQPGTQSQVIMGPGVFRLVKGQTDQAVTVYMDT